jgi:subtilisin family serine protease
MKATQHNGVSTMPIVLAFLMLISSAGGGAELSKVFLVKQSVRLEKPAAAISEETIRNLTQRDGDNVRVWVMFTDKGLPSESDFNTVAESVIFTERKQARRAKVELAEPVFADLPLNTDYVEAVTEAGGRLRRQSRWLNAASFELPAAALRTVAALPFVYEIRPLGLWRRPAEPAVEPIRVDPPDPLSLSPDVLNYGLALSQLTQIRVPELHEQGYDGSGVTLAIFDTGYRKTHEAFADHWAEGRVIAEWDFIFNDGNTSNEAADASSQWNHGTYIWSTSAGFANGTLIGPAYKANYILCKTEDVRSETPVEEDNWVAALEWVDSLGADVVTSSLSYLDWDDGTGYDYSDLDGQTAVTSIAASMAASMGIVVCNSAGNSGPTSPSVSAPVDAFDILAIGAVDGSGNLASFSSRGPTFDGRIKPEVLARGVSTQCAVTSTDASYGGVSGTSLSTPLVAGVACLLIQAHPDFTPQMIRASLMETASNAATPNNNLGWGLVDAVDAAAWGANFYSDTQFGFAPLEVQFYDSSTLAASSRAWAFGDGGSSTDINPSHTYQSGGAFPVSLTIETSYGPVTRIKDAYIIALADTLWFESDSAYAGNSIIASVNMANSQMLEEMTICFKLDTSSQFSFDSVTLGDRTSYFEYFEPAGYVPGAERYAYTL